MADTVILTDAQKAEIANLVKQQLLNSAKPVYNFTKITDYSNGHKFRSGAKYSDTCTSDAWGQWNLFYFDGSYWNTVCLDKRPW